MSNPVWPPSLPEYVSENGYTEKPVSNTTGTRMEGALKIRRRFTARFRRYTVTVILSAAQVATFETFFHTTLADGSIPFDWVHPASRAAATFRFLPGPDLPYEYAKQGGYWTRVMMNLEQTP